MKGTRLDDGIRVLNWTVNLAFVGLGAFLIWYLGWLWGLACIAFGLAGAYVKSRRSPWRKRDKELEQKLAELERERP